MSTEEKTPPEFKAKFEEWTRKADFPDQTSVARRAGVDPAGLGRMLDGERGMRAETARKLAKALGVPQIEFFRAAGLLDPQPKGLIDLSADELEKREVITRILAKLDGLNDSDLARVEAIIKAYTSAASNVAIDTSLPPIQSEITLGGKLTPKHIKGKGRPA